MAIMAANVVTVSVMNTMSRPRMCMACQVERGRPSSKERACRANDRLLAWRMAPANTGMMVAHIALTRCGREPDSMEPPRIACASRMESASWANVGTNRRANDSTNAVSCVCQCSRRSGESNEENAAVRRVGVVVSSRRAPNINTMAKRVV